MARVIRSRRVLEFKLIYYGPGLGGKTTNLERLHSRFPASHRGSLVKLDTETERTLFFDYFPGDLGEVGGYRLKADMFTVPGQSFYNLTRRNVLEGCDGIVFVADSSERREEANIESLENLKENLRTYGRSLDTIPYILQWNKRDLKDAMPVKRMEAILNPEGRPSIEAIASEDVGVWETQARLIKEVVRTYNVAPSAEALGA